MTTRSIFDPRFYRRHNGLSSFWRRDLARSHYRLIGRRRGYQPSPLFSPPWFSRRVHDEGLGDLRLGDELRAYLEQAALWRTDPHPFAFFRFEPFASAGPTENPLARARETLAVAAPLGVGHPLIPPGAWVSRGPDDRIDDRASVEVAMSSVAEHVTAALRQGRDIESPEPPDVLFINGEAHCPACTQYRIWAPARALEATGLRVSIVEAHDLGRLEGVVPRVRVVIVFRARMTHTLRRFITRARHLGATIGFDCDDLLFGPPLQVGLQADSYGYREVHGFNVHSADITEVARASDFAVVPTETLAAVLDELGTQEDAVTVVPSFLTPQQLAATEHREVGQQRRSRVCAASGTWTHHEDFASAVEPISAALAAEPDLDLTMIGAVMPSAFRPLDRVRAQVSHDQTILRDWTDYVSRYAGFRANLVPLDVDNGFCQAKSEVKYIEAALARTASVGSATEAYERALSAGGGILVRRPEDWTDAVLSIARDGSRARSMGETAHADVIRRYGPRGLFAERYVETIQRHLDGRHEARATRRKTAQTSLPPGVDGWVRRTRVPGILQLLTPGASVRMLKWNPRLLIDGEEPVPEETLFFLDTPRAADHWLRAGGRGEVVAAGADLAAVLTQRIGRQVTVGAQWVDPTLAYQRVDHDDTGVVVLDAGRAGQEDAPSELNAAVIGAVNHLHSAGLEPLVVARKAAFSIDERVEVWVWPGSVVELASLIRKADAAIRLDPLLWDEVSSLLHLIGPGSESIEALLGDLLGRPPDSPSASDL